MKYMIIGFYKSYSYENVSTWTCQNDLQLIWQLNYIKENINTDLKKLIVYKLNTSMLTIDLHSEYEFNQ